MAPNQSRCKGEYRLARVLELKPDDDQVVRSVVIGTRNRRGRTRGVGNKQGLVESIMAVQRLITLLPVEEQWKGGLAQEA